MATLTPQELDAHLAEILARLRREFAPVAVYLYGSYAYGTPAPHSDIDLLIVIEDSPLDPYERDARAYRLLGDIPVPVDLQVYTRSEFEARAALPVSFERTVARKGKRIDAA